MTSTETYEDRWARRNAKLKERIANIPSRFTNEALYEPRLVGSGLADAEDEFFGTSFTMFSRLVSKAAVNVAWQWPGVLTSEEAEQEIWLKLMESPGSMKKLRDSFDDKQRLNAIIQMGHQIGNRLLNEEMIATGNFRYSVNAVKNILKDAAEQERDPSAKKVTKSALLDMKRGMEALREKNAGYAEAISERYRSGEIPLAGAASSRLSRALTALTTCMNREHKRNHAVRDDGPGTRKAISSAAARVVSTTEWQGDYGDGRR